MTDIDVLTQILPPIGAAAAAYGAAVLTQGEDTAAEKTVRLGQRLLAKILRKDDPAGAAKGSAASVDGVKRAVLDLATAAAEELADAQAALRLELRRLLAADPQLRDDLAALLPPAAATAAGGRTINVAGDVSGIVSAGDRTVNIQAN